MLTRIATAVLAGSIALAAILWREPWGFLLLLILVGFLALREGAALTQSKVIQPSDTQQWVAITVLGSVLVAISIFSRFPFGSIGVIWTVGLMALLLRHPDNQYGRALLCLWILSGLFAAFLLQVQFVGADAPFRSNLLLLALLPLWVGDSLAYFVGKAIGKHKMAPSISPNKTWEGAVANLLGCLGAAYGIGAWLGVPLVASLAVGLTTGVLGQVGDLLQSRLKRLANVKDSGSILPGHGGILDRLDSFLFSSYPSLLALYLLAPDMFHVKQWPW